MKKHRSFCIFAVLILIATLTIMPVLAYAEGDEALIVPEKSFSEKDNIPPKEDISPDPDYSEGFVLTKSTVGGGCSITKLSSSSLSIFGYTTCSEYDPEIEIDLYLQSYYNGSWHTMSSRIKVSSGTYVSTSQAYTVTSGYYYRAYAAHTISDATTAYSYSNAILVD